MRLAVSGLGAAPALAAATVRYTASPNPNPNPNANANPNANPNPNPNPNQVRYTVRLDSAFPGRGSLGGGTTLTLAGSGLSQLASDVAVTVGGVRCRVSTVNYTQAT